MGKYKLKFNLQSRKMVRDCQNKADCTDRAYHLEKNGASEIEALEYKQKVNDQGIKRCGWFTFSPSSTCRRCGRDLNATKSVQEGIGPECRKKVGSAGNGSNSENITRSVPIDVELSIHEKFHIPDTCRFCGTKLEPGMQYYEHEGGWLVKALGEKRVWLWIECPKCGHEWSLKALGIGTLS